MTEQFSPEEQAKRRLDRAVTDNFGEDTVEVKREDIRTALTALSRETRERTVYLHQVIRLEAALKMRGKVAFNAACRLRIREHLSASWSETLGFDALRADLTPELALRVNVLQHMAEVHYLAALLVQYDVENDEQDHISDILAGIFIDILHTDEPR